MVVIIAAVVPVLEAAMALIGTALVFLNAILGAL